MRDYKQITPLHELKERVEKFQNFGWDKLAKLVDEELPKKVDSEVLEKIYDLKQDIFYDRELFAHAGFDEGIYNGDITKREEYVLVAALAREL